MTDVNLQMGGAMSIDVSLPPEMELRVREQVALPAFQTAQAAKLAALQGDIDRGIADIAAGRVREFDATDLKAKGRERLAATRAGGSAV